MRSSLFCHATIQSSVRNLAHASLETAVNSFQSRRVFVDDSECREYYEDAWIFGDEAIAAAEAAEAAADSASGNGTEEAGVSDPNGNDANFLQGWGAIQ